MFTSLDYVWRACGRRICLRCRYPVHHHLRINASRHTGEWRMMLHIHTRDCECGRLVNTFPAEGGLPVKLPKQVKSVVRVPVPFALTEEVGLGDAIKQLTSMVGVSPCEGC